MPGVADDLHRSADAIVHFEGHAGRSKPGHGPVELHYQALVRPALESQSAEGVVVRYDDLVVDHMDHVGIVPDDLGRERSATDLHAVDVVLGQMVSDDQRAVVIGVLLGRFDPASAASPIGLHGRVQCVDVDTDYGAFIASENVIGDHRLGAPNEDRRGSRPHASVSITPTAARIVVDHAIGDSHIRLLDFDGIEEVEVPFDGGLTAGVGDERMVDATLGDRGEVQAGPIPRHGARTQRIHRRDERSGCPVTSIQQRGKDHGIAEVPLGNQLGTDFGLNACPIQFDDDTGIDCQSRIGSRQQPGGSRVLPRSAGGPGDDQVLGNQVDDVDIIEAGIDFEFVCLLPFEGVDANENTVERIIHQVIAVDIGPYTVVVGREGVGLELRVLEAVWIPRQGRIGALNDRIRGDRGSGFDHVDRRVHATEGIHLDLPTAVAHVRMVDVVQKDAFIFQDRAVECPIQILPKDETTPVTLLGQGRSLRLAVAADLLVVERGEVDAVFRRT